MYSLTDRMSGLCSFDIIDVGNAGVIQNGYFVINTTLNMAGYHCVSLSVSAFDSVEGKFNNVSLIGNVSIDNLDLTNFDTS